MDGRDAWLGSGSSRLIPGEHSTDGRELVWALQSVAATDTYRCKFVESREQIVEDADQLLGSALAGQGCKQNTNSHCGAVRFQVFTAVLLASAPSSSASSSPRTTT